MAIFLSHFSALHFWRHMWPLGEEVNRPASVQFDALNSPISLLDLKANPLPPGFFDGNGKVDLITADPTAHVRSQSLRCHRWTTPLPQRAFHKARNGLYVSSPEFVFAQMASLLGVEELAALGMELCGLYVLEGKEERAKRISIGRRVSEAVEAANDNSRQRRRAPYYGQDDEVNASPRRLSPLTTPTRLKNAVAATAGARGHRNAERALRFVTARSASPYETLTCLFLCLSSHLGGYGLPLPKMNLRVEFDESIYLATHCREAYCDLAWPLKHLDLEYLGSVHKSEERKLDDRTRRTALELAGYHVIEVTEKQLLSVQGFEAIANQVADHLGKPLVNAKRGVSPKRIEMRRRLLEWTHCGGTHPAK